MKTGVLDFVRQHWILTGLVVLAVILSAGVVAFAMGDKEPITYTWHYKITVTVDTPEGEKSGSAVREVRTEFHPMPEREDYPYRIKTKVSGEAVPVDLGKRGMVFALIDWNSYLELYNAFPYGGQMYGKSKFPRDEYYKKILKPGMKAELKTDIPRMVMFKDIKDPKTVQLVYWQQMGTYVGKIEKVTDNFESIFGKGVKLKDITIEMTDEPVTWQIEKVLGWLDGLHGHYLHGGMTSREAPLGLHAGNFRTGDLK
jgi:hypothetical protein